MFIIRDTADCNQCVSLGPFESEFRNTCTSNVFRYYRTPPSLYEVPNPKAGFVLAEISAVAVGARIPSGRYRRLFAWTCLQAQRSNSFTSTTAGPCRIAFRPKATVNGLFGGARNGERNASLRWAGGIARLIKANRAGLPDRRQTPRQHHLCVRSPGHFTPNEYCRAARLSCR